MKMLKTSTLVAAILVAATVVSSAQEGAPPPHWGYEGEFALKQFHFHSPSENTIRGRSFPMEAHLVHVDGKGNLAVVALMFEEGEGNAVLEKIWQKVPKVENGKEALRPEVSAAELLGRNRDYYRYSGSLTTPPCSEGVRWLVLKHPAKASAEQLGLLVRTLGHPNNRPVQPVGAREVLQ